MEEKYHDQIDRYVRNEMTQEEKVAFEQQMLNDVNLKSEVDLTRRIRSSLSDRRNKLRKTSELMHKKRNMTIRMVSIVSVAAIIAIGFFVWNDSENNIVNDSSSLTVMVSDEGKVKEKAVAKVRQAINKGNDEAIVEAVDELERDRLIPSINNVKELKLMSNNVSEQNDSVTVDAYELYWIKINSLINIGDTLIARKNLVDYITIEGVHQKEAKRLLKKITCDID